MHEDDRAGDPHDFAMRFDEFAKPHRADELHVQLDGGVRLVAGRAQRRHAHGLIGERHKQAAMHDVGEVQMPGLNDDTEPGVTEPPDRPDQFTEAGLLHDFPASTRGIERRGLACCRLVIHAGTLVAPERAASRRLRSAMSFSALSPSQIARPSSPSARTAAT